MYPEGYMYPSCIPMYLKCILNALLHSKRIFSMYFTRNPNESKIHFEIHVRYIRIHVSWALPWCHTGYISGNIRIHVSWTLHHDTSGYTEIQNHDTCILVLGRVMTTLQDTIRIHEGYIRDTCGIHAGYMYLDPRGSGALLIHVYKAPTLHLFGN